MSMIQTEFIFLIQNLKTEWKLSILNKCVSIGLSSVRQLKFSSVIYLDESKPQRSMSQLSHYKLKRT